MKTKVLILILAMVILCSSSVMGENTIFFNGLYQSEKDEDGYYSYLRLFEDGTVLGGISNRGTAEQVARWFNKSGNYPIGRYSIQGSRIKFTSKFHYAGVTRTRDYEGDIKGETLTLRWTYKGKQFEIFYKFVPVATLAKGQVEKKIVANLTCNPYGQPVSIVLMNSEFVEVAKKEIKYDGAFKVSESLIDLTTGSEIKKWAFDENTRRKEAAMFLCLDEIGNIIRDNKGNPRLVNTFQVQQKIETSIRYNRYNPTQKAGEETIIYSCENCEKETDGICSYVW